MATQEITVTYTPRQNHYSTAILRNTYTTSLANDKLTISGTLSLIADGFIEDEGTIWSSINNASVSIDNSELVSINFKSIYADNPSETTSRPVQREETLGTYSKVISRTHSAQTVMVLLLADRLTTTYNGWVNVGSAKVEEQARSTAISLAAKPSYTISYNANGGSSTPASQTKWYNEALTLASAITRDKYLFGGWKWNNTGTAVAAGSLWNAANATGTFYAAWEYKYQSPSITRVTAWRTGTTASGGVYPKQDDGTNADIQVVLTAGKEKATAGGSYSVASTTVKFYYKLNTASSYTLLSTQTLSSATGTLTAHISSTLDTDKQYDVKVEAYITASTTDSTSFTSFISTSFFLVDMTQDGVAFGRSAESNKFLCNLPTTIYNSLNVSPPSGVSAYNINGVALSASNVGALPTRPTSIEFQPSSSSAGNGGFIDFHYNQSTADYTSRIIEAASGTLLVTGGLRVNNHASAIGDVKYAYAAAKTVNNNTNTNLTSLSLEAGIWVITAGVRFPSNSTGLRRLNIATSSGSANADVQLMAVNGGSTQLAYTLIVSPTATTTYYLNCYQNSGSNLSLSAGGGENGLNFIRAVRIA